MEKIIGANSKKKSNIPRKVLNYDNNNNRISNNNRVNKITALNEDNYNFDQNDEIQNRNQDKQNDEDNEKDDNTNYEEDEYENENKYWQSVQTTDEKCVNKCRYMINNFECSTFLDSKLEDKLLYGDKYLNDTWKNCKIINERDGVMVDSGCNVAVTSLIIALENEWNIYVLNEKKVVTFGGITKRTATHAVNLGNIIGEVIIIEDVDGILISVEHFTARGYNVCFKEEQLN